MTDLFGRLAPGATLEGARAELVAVHGDMMRENPDSYSPKADLRVSATPLRDQIAAPARPILLLLLAAAGVVVEEAHPDLTEVACVETKKSIGVEQVRDLGTWIAQSPALGLRKAAIVDPAGALTSAAANALLKTLEEPPPGRVIVLIATSPGACVMS